MVVADRRIPQLPGFLYRATPATSGPWRVRTSDQRVMRLLPARHHWAQLGTARALLSTFLDATRRDLAPLVPLNVARHPLCATRSA